MSLQHIVKRRGLQPKESLLNAKFPKVSQDENQTHEPRNPLHDEKPISGVGVTADVRLGRERNDDTKDRVERQGQKDTEDFDGGQARKGLNLAHGGIESLATPKAGGVCPEVGPEEDADRDDPRKRMQLP
jgi:hypothetical protein